MSAGALPAKDPSERARAGRGDRDVAGRVVAAPCGIRCRERGGAADHGATLIPAFGRRAKAAISRAAALLERAEPHDA